jgi:hypothetical protein
MQEGPRRSKKVKVIFIYRLYKYPLLSLGSVDIHAMARKAAERWMKAQKLVSVLS